MNQKKENDKEKKDGINEIYKEVGPYLEIGLQMALTVGLMVFIGIYLDDYFNTKPYMTISFSMLGIFAALYNFLKSVLKSDK